MKIGIITDIHSNIQALNAVLKEFDKIKVDKIICCGDMIGIGINPEEVMQTLIKRQEMIIFVTGNHERYLLKGFPRKVHDSKRIISKEEVENHKWNHSLLSKESIDFLKKIERTAEIEIEGKKIYIIHYPLNSDGTFQKHIKNPTIEENKEMFKEIDADIYLYGHTHTYTFNTDSNKMYINTGALGCPLDENFARAGLLEINKGEIHFEEIKVKYDVKSLIEEIKKIAFPGYKPTLNIFYGQKIK